MCLICLGAIKPTEAVWQCSSSCYVQFHLPCIQVGAWFVAVLLLAFLLLAL
jgi:hypothetical protein